MRTVLTYGTFDVLHIGHINLLRRARELGDRLIVGLSTDEFNAVKHKSSLLDYPNRRATLEAIRYVDLVIPEVAWEQKVDDVRKYDVDIFVIGDDWAGQFDFLKELCEVRYLSRTAEISSTSVKQTLLARNGVMRNPADGGQDPKCGELPKVQPMAAPKP